MTHRISVVILTHGRITYVKKLFDSLSTEIKNDAGDLTVEVIVVDDSLAPDRRRIQDLCKESAYNYYFFKGNVPAKRNFGIEKSKEEILLFIDSDCEVSQGLLKKHAVSYTDSIIGGVLGVTKFSGEKGVCWNAIQQTFFTAGFSFPEFMSHAPWGPCTNISFKHSVLNQIGGFNPIFRLGGEDVDLGIRINKAGYKIKCISDATAFHTTKTWGDPFKAGLKFFKWGRADFHILKTHPQLADKDFPKFLPIFLLILVLFLIEFFTRFKSLSIKTAVTWVVSCLLFETILRLFADKQKTWNVVSVLLAIFFNLTFEAGAIFESLKKGSLSMLYQKITYTSSQNVTEWDSRIIRSWSIVIGFLITLGVILTN
jgi:GT2 family glycosyltransferase